MGMRSRRRAGRQPDHGQAQYTEKLYNLLSVDSDDRVMAFTATLRSVVCNTATLPSLSHIIH